MKLAAILLARVAAWVEVEELTPQNQVGRVRLSEGLRERYSFLKAPQTLEEFDVQKDGIQFQSGRHHDIVIERLVFYMKGIVVETRSSTTDCEKVLADLVAWIQEQAGVSEAVRIIRTIYLSQLTFYSDRSLELVNSRLGHLANWLSDRITEGMRTRLEYGVIGIHFGFDELTYQLSPGRLVIERRADAPFSENKYFSAAPLRTEDHLEFLRRFEAVLGETVESSQRS